MSVSSVILAAAIVLMVGLIVGLEIKAGHIFKK